MDAGAWAVQAQGISRSFYTKETKQTTQALRDISLTVPHGAVTALVGPDGAGKTTFLRLIAGLLLPDSGSLTVLGVDAAASPQEIQNRISYMPQKFGLYEDLSVQENLDLYADLHGVPQDVRRERFARLLEMTDLARFTERPAGKLSGGMKQKLGLACTLVRSPDLLLLDEPTVGVDPLSRRELWEIIAQLVGEESLSVVLATAYMDEAERCAQVYVMHEGQLLAEGTPQSLRRQAEGHCFSYTPPPDVPPRTVQAALLDNTAEVIDAVPHAGQVHFIVRGTQVPASLGLAPERVTPVAAGLEDSFMMLLRARQENDAGADVSAIENSGAPLARDDAPAIAIHDLVRRFGDFVAVDHTTFDVAHGEIFGLLGPNGAGKTTTFRMLCGLLPASSGEARVAGLDMRTAAADARRRIGYVSQKFALYGNLSVLENLHFFGQAYGLRGKRLRERSETVLRQLDLRGWEQKRAGELAGGLKQRLAMAVGLLHEPEILFLDEPTSGADPLARRAFWRRITALAQSGTTIVITTHFMEEAEYCDRMVIQDAGKILALGTPAEVRRQAGETDAQRLDMEQAFIGIVEKARAERKQ
ncbi:MAG: ATP-binding cassette domain-containing protein [Neisseria sp.]|uniref:ATP-binding cassette domain-containing protein n=1 Tax=Neisseria sp. TaxID=192066 RepID=UPI0026DCD128|nr:ATP-binding cassette domain-containing protein [Neisseria sp.]MDO4248344.1 ATP-binding cassette domain-containing protein [Neisseria sp.]